MLYVFIVIIILHKHNIDMRCGKILVSTTSAKTFPAEIAAKRQTGMIARKTRSVYIC